MNMESLNLKGLKVLLTAGVFAAFFTVSCQQQQGSSEGSSDTTAISEAQQESQDEDWIVLFDGQSVDNWRGYKMDSFPSQGWAIEDNALKCIGSGQGEAGGAGGDIITRDMYEDFELEFEWKISEGGNSGVFYMAREIENEPIWKSAPEYQVLDNEKHPDAKLGKEGNRQAASLYDLIPAKPQNAKTPGEWNSGKILKYQGTVAHYLNDEVVLEYHLGTDDWKEMVQNSKFAEFEPFAQYSEGHIGLQDHGNDVWYRNIRIKEL
jgi:hypothetical protein